jgi:hypothetical protein
MMGGQGSFKHAREMRGWMLLNEYKKRSLRAMKGNFVFVETIVVCVEIRACKNL